MSEKELLNIPPECQLLIFEHLNIESLGRLQQTCQKFRNMIANESALWKRKSNFVLYSNSYANEMWKRCKLTLTPKEKIGISRLWCKGAFQHTNTVFTYTETMPWIVQEKDLIILSLGFEIRTFKREHNGNAGQLLAVRNIVTREEISKFVVNEDHIVIAYSDGKLSFDAKETLFICSVVRAHSEAVYCIDAKDNIVVSGSKDKSFKIWKGICYTGFELVKSFDMQVKILSTAILPSCKSVLVGSPGTQNIHPLQLYDLETTKFISNLGETFKNGAGYLDIYPENEHTFLCGGYETTVQLWDVRSPNACVAKWSDPDKNSIFCVKSDHNISIISGSSRNITHFWDKRVPDKSVFLHTFEDFTTPVYSLGFDHSHLYLAYSACLQEHSFIK